METPQEKANELFKKYYKLIFDIDLGADVSKDTKRYEAAKQCAILAVNEIINAIRGKCLYEDWHFWIGVIKEIELI